jgi:hypothetical protein
LLILNLSFVVLENIRSAPPAAEEWWEDVAGESDDGHDYEDAHSDDGHSEGYETIVIKSLSRQKRFQNCGLETWLRVREKWTRRTVETLPPRPTPAEYAQLVKGLTKSSSLRSYELPRRMALSDLIGVYNDIWDGGGTRN